METITDNNYWSLVTGASGGIGLHFAEELAKEGHNLILVARNAAKLDQLAKTLIEKHQVKVDVIPCDLGKADKANEFVDKIKNYKIDILINNAGIGLYGEFYNTALSAELNMIQLNITSLTQITKAVLPQMKKRNSGKILNIASTAAFQPGPLMAVYFATKAYVLSFSEAIAKELEDTNITVTAFCPGATESGFQNAAKAENSKLFNQKLPNAKEVAIAGLAAMNSGKRVSIHGAMNWVLTQSVRVAPRNVVLSIVKMKQDRA